MSPTAETYTPSNFLIETPPKIKEPEATATMVLFGIWTALEPNAGSRSVEGSNTVEEFAPIDDIRIHDAMLASEAVLRAIWVTPQEDEAWKNL